MKDKRSLLCLLNWALRIVLYLIIKLYFHWIQQIRQRLYMDQIMRVNMLDQVYSGNERDIVESKNWTKIEFIFKWLCLWVGYYVWIWEKYIIILFIVLDVRCDIFFENALIDFWVIIGIILLKVAIPLDVVSIYKSWGRMRDVKRSCLIIVDNRQKNLPDLIY